MAGFGTAAVKCEPLSDEEDDSPQFPDIFHNTNSSGSGFLALTSLKVEAGYHNDEGMPTLLQHLQSSEALEELAPPAPAAPTATPVCVKQERVETPALNLETLEPAPHAGSLLERRMVILRSSEVPDSANFMPLPLMAKEEHSSEGEQQPLSADELSDSCGLRAGPKAWSQQDMDNALDALRNHNMSLTKASSMYGIPSTTLWQRAHRLGIDTPKKEGAAKSWSEADLRAALHALRAGAISANKASKAYGIPSSTLYKIARREGIRLAAPFNAAPVSWRRGDLQRALAAIRAGRASVQRAASQYGIPTGTLYGRCKREGIELSRSNPTPWSEGAMGEALEAVRVGQMSINQAAIHYNLPYSSLYGRFKRCKYQIQPIPQQETQIPQEMVPSQEHYYHPMGMYPEHEYSQPPPPPHAHELVQHSHNLQEQYPQPMYYQSFSSIATS